MSAYCYLKAEPKTEKRFLKYLPVSLLMVGLFLLANVTFPIFSYELKSRSTFTGKLLSPINQTGSQVLGENLNVNYQEPSSWFPSAPELPPQPSKITHYRLSIPILKIKDAAVEIGGEDLMESLVHYPGTALPGQYGNTVIFGHSILPQFFNPRNYKTIFSTLPTLDEGDEILIDFDGVNYSYKVSKMVEVGPKDISVLAQYYDSQYLTLITCVPPGTYLRRLVVRAKLQ